MAPFVDYLLRTEHLLIMLGVWVIISLVRRAVPELDDNAAWRRLLPGLPILLCSIAVWSPGLVDGAPSEKILLGLVLGASCGHAHKLYKQSLFGNYNRRHSYQGRL